MSELKMFVNTKQQFCKFFISQEGLILVFLLFESTHDYWMKDKNMFFTISIRRKEPILQKMQESTTM